MELSEIEKEYYIHVSFEKLYDTELNFYPRIPKNRLENENNTIKRICVSTSISGAFNAIYQTINAALDLNFHGPFLKPIYVYGIKKSEVTAKDIYDNNYLYKNHLVPDVLITDEYWILKPIKMEFLDAVILKNSEEDYAKLNSGCNINWRYDSTIISDSIKIEFFSLGDCKDDVQAFNLICSKMSKEISKDGPSPYIEFNKGDDILTFLEIAHLIEFHELNEHLDEVLTDLNINNKRVRRSSNL